ncbi:MAG: hypothetical protein HYY76_08790 [Acidobacteria bacterium]|nr:hypothetical protein [Acidobacteriota bacterium]
MTRVIAHAMRASSVPPSSVYRSAAVVVAHRVIAGSQGGVPRRLRAASRVAIGWDRDCTNKLPRARALPG